MEWSFNAAVGVPLHAITLILISAGIYFNFPNLILWAGYVSVINGVLLLVNTIINQPFIGTILAPVMLLSMVLLIIVGACLAFQPLSLLISAWIPNFESIALFIYLGIFAFVIIHVSTGL